MHTFSEIIGQDNIKAHLQNALRTGAVSHAYLLAGDEGSGKKTIASLFAAALQCERPQERDGLLEPCGRCLSCIQAEAGSQPDILTVEHAKPNTIGVDDIRKMRADVQIKPYRSDRKLYLIPEAEKMTAQAQNALLKTIEEPPAYAVILLLANGLSAFLPTVLSRCVVLRTQPVPEEAIADWLVKKSGVAPQKAALCAGFAAGSPGRAAALAGDETFETVCAQTVELLRRLPSMDAHDIAQAAQTLTQQGTDLSAVLSFLQTWYRDVLRIKATGGTERLIFTEEVQYSKEAADSLSYERLQKITEAFDLAARRRRANGNAELILEMLLLSLREQSRGGAPAGRSQ